MKILFGAAVLALVALAAVLWTAAAFTFSALPEPGAMETRFANAAKHWQIRRAARSVSSPPAGDTKASVKEGSNLYGVHCQRCHGQTGRTPTTIGRWMYPRAADLGSDRVQKWSDAELFWIAKNGIRMTGMPAFGKTETDENLWHIVHFLRTLRNGPMKAPDAGD